MKTNYEEIVDVHAIGGLNTKKVNDLLPLASAENVKPAIEDEEKVLLLAIDFQNDFMENGALGVPGSHNDIENTNNFIYKNLEKITRIAVSLDTHQPQQIFHPSWWIDENGSHPTPFTIITAEDVQNGKWRAVVKPKESLEYVQKIEENGKKQLCIWTYHCLEGSFGAALENQFSNMVYFHSVARKSITQRLVKGKDPLSEMYGIIKPEYDKKNYINIDFLNQLENYDKIVVVGEAKSHCVLESVAQILEYYKDREDVTRKIYVLEDCMSPIPGFEDPTEQAFTDFKQNFNINIVKSTDLVL